MVVKAKRILWVWTHSIPNSTICLFVFCFVFLLFETRSVCSFEAYPETISCRPGWLLASNSRNPRDSAPQLLWLMVCATAAWLGCSISNFLTTKSGLSKYTIVLCTEMVYATIHFLKGNKYFLWKTKRNYDEPIVSNTGCNPSHTEVISRPPLRHHLLVSS